MCSRHWWSRCIFLHLTCASVVPNLASAPLRILTPHLFWSCWPLSHVYPCTQNNSVEKGSSLWNFQNTSTMTVRDQTLSSKSALEDIARLEQTTNSLTECWLTIPWSMYTEMERSATPKDMFHDVFESYNKGREMIQASVATEILNPESCTFFL